MDRSYSTGKQTKIETRKMLEYRTPVDMRYSFVNVSFSLIFLNFSYREKIFHRFSRPVTTLSEFEINSEKSLLARTYEILEIIKHKSKLLYLFVCFLLLNQT